MKTLNKKNIVLVVLSFVLALSMLAFAGSVKPVHAANENITHFVMMDESSLRLDGQASGLRFRVQMDEATAYYVKGYDKETQTTNNDNGVTMGFLIAPKVYFDRAIQNAADKTNIDYFSALPAYVGDDGVGIIAKDATKDNVYLGEDGNYYANGVVGTLREGNVDLEFAAIAYIKDGTNVTFATRNEDFARTYKETASKAVLSGNNKLSDLQKAAYLTDFGTETNPIQINDDADMDLALNSGNALENLSIAIMTKDTSSSSSSATSSVPFNGALDFYANTTNSAAISIKTQLASNYTYGKATYQTKEQLASDAIDNGFDDNSNAISVSNLTTTGTYIYADMSYTAEEYQKLYDAGKFNVVKFNYLAETDTDFMTNWCYAKAGYYSMLAGAGYYGDFNSHTAAQKLPKNVWQTHIITAEEFIETMLANTNKSLVARISWSGTGTYVNFHFGNIEFLTMTDEQIAAHAVYKCALGFKPSTDTTSYIVEDHSKNYTQEFVSAETLATLTGLNGATIDNSVGYTGDAVVMRNFNGNSTHVGVRTVYNEAQIQGLIDRYNYTKVTFSMMFVPLTAVEDVTNNDQVSLNKSGEYVEGNNAYNMLSAAGYRSNSSMNTRSISCHKWYTFTIDIDEHFMDAIWTVRGYSIFSYIRLAKSSVTSWDIYFGEVVFS